MNFIKNIIQFLKKLFNKENDIKMIKAPAETVQNETKINFINSLKVNIAQKHKKKKIETLVCPGDGLRIQTKIRY